MKKFLILTLSVIYCVHLHAQPFGLDPSFANNGVLHQNFFSASSSERVADVVSLDNGKILLALSRDDDSSYLHLVRLNTDGSTDITYGNNGLSKTPLQYNGEVFLQSNGKSYLVSSNADALLGATPCRTNIHRLKPDGAVDSTFNTDGLFSLANYQSVCERVTDLIELPNGKVLCAGWYVPDQSMADQNIFLLQLDAGGNLDMTFGTNGLFRIPIQTLIFQRWIKFPVLVLPDN